MKKKFEIGDIVELAVDSPEMVVSGFTPSNTSLVFCEWFNREGESWHPQKQVFHENLLLLVEKAEPKN